MSAALQHLDLDVFWDMWEPPQSLIDKSRLRGAPQHGIGRTCKAGKEEIAGVLTALRLFVAEGDAARHKKWLAACGTIAAELEGKGARVAILGAEDAGAVPLVEIAAGDAVAEICKRLQDGAPPIIVDLALRDRGIIIVNPMCLAQEDARLVGARIAALL